MRGGPGSKSHIWCFGCVNNTDFEVCVDIIIFNYVICN